MTFDKIQYDDLGVTVEISTFAPAGGVVEHHMMLHVAPRGEHFERQWARLSAAEEALLQRPLFRDASVVFKRYFLSDAANQAPLMQPSESGAVSVIQQPPLDGSKVAAWFYLQTGPQVKGKAAGTTFVEHNGYRHIWHAGLHATSGNSAEQTEQVLNSYETFLRQQDATIAEHCVRTWFFVRDVDTQYAGLVKARLDNFLQQGLTPDTHYIASTGIGGLPADRRSIVYLDTYALTGFSPQQQRHLHALTHLNPTIEYGVTFERGTVIEYGDRAHAFISGTASIDNKGKVVHVGDIERQTHRMWENVEALLKEADMTIGQHAMQIIVYLRDMADYATVRDLFAQRFPHIPTLITLAPVCRPEWLIEMECITAAPRRHENFRDF